LLSALTQSALLGSHGERGWFIHLTADSGVVEKSGDVNL